MLRFQRLFEMENLVNMEVASKAMFSKELIHEYLYGYQTSQLVTSEELLSSLQKEVRRHGCSLPETPPLSPRKIRTPDDISLCTSSIPGNKFGACAIKRIPHGTWFGPFEGKLVRLNETSGINTEHMWEIFHDGEVSHFLDGQGENTWMSFVCCARHKHEQNLVVFQYHGCIYYRTIKDIHPGNELLVWYDNKYTQLLGLPIAWNDNRSAGGKKKSSEENSKKRKEKVSPIPLKEKVSPIPLLQKLDSKLPSPNSKKSNDIEMSIDKRRNELLSPSFDITPTIRCDKCFFTFSSIDQLNQHKCLNSSPWLPGLRVPSLNKAANEYFQHQTLTSLKMPVPTPAEQKSYYHSYYHSYHYPSPPLDHIKQLSSTQPLLTTPLYKNASLALKNL